MLYAALRASTARPAQEKFGQAQPLPRIAAEKDGSSTNGRTKYFSRAGLRGNGHVLAMVGHLKNVSPTFAQMPNRITNVEFTTVNPTIANTMLYAVFCHRAIILSASLIPLKYAPCAVEK